MLLTLHVLYPRNRDIRNLHIVLVISSRICVVMGDDASLHHSLAWKITSRLVFNHDACDPWSARVTGSLKTHLPLVGKIHATLAYRIANTMMFMRTILALYLSAFVFAIPVAQPQVIEIGGPNGIEVNNVATNIAEANTLSPPPFLSTWDKLE